MQLLSRNEPHETRKYKRTKRLCSPRLEKVQMQHGYSGNRSVWQRNDITSHCYTFIINR